MKKDFDALLDALNGDRDRLLLNDNELAALVDDGSSKLDKWQPVAAVSPVTVEEVKAIVRVANECGLTLKPRGSGFGLGTALPSENGVVVDLRRMDRIIEINESGLYALVEPGVTFQALAEALSRKNLVVSIPDAPPETSVVAHHLNFGIGGALMEFGHGGQLLLGVEAVLPSGEIIRTGSGASPHSSYFSRVGFPPLPDLTGLFVGGMGTTGIVTQASVQVFPKPGFVRYRKFGFSSIESAVAAMKQVSRGGLVDRVIGNNWVMAPESSAVLDASIDGAPISATRRDAIRSKLSDIPEVFFFVGVHGFAPAVEARMAEAGRLITKAYAGVEMPMSDGDTEKYYQIANGLPHAQGTRTISRVKGRYKEAFDLHYVYVPVEAVPALYAEWCRIGAEHGHLFAMNAKFFAHCRMAAFNFVMTYFDQKDRRDRHRITELGLRLQEAAAAHGAVSANALSREAQAALSSHPLQKRIMAALDPNNVMA